MPLNRAPIAVPIAILIAAVLVVLAVRDSSTSAAAPPFDPGAVLCFENLESPPECDGDSSPGAQADIRTTFCLGWGADCTVQPVVSQVDDSLYSLAAFFTPSAWTVPSAGALPIGALSGQVSSRQTLGLLNGACNSSIEASFTLMNASVNIGDTISPKPAGQANPMEPLALNTSPQNGVPDGADKYPSFLNALFANAQPRARLFGISRIQGTWTAVNLVVFNPGATVTIAGSALHFDPALGYPAFAVLQNPTAPDSPSAISDFCAPELTMLTVLGKTLNNPCTPTPVAGANCPGVGITVQNAGYPFLPCESVNSADEDADGKINDGCPQVNFAAEFGVQCDNNTSDDGEDSAINDGCPASGPVSEGSRIQGTCTGTDEGGCTFRQNPASAGAQTFTIWTASNRDADGDGIDNVLDVCALVVNGAWNPRASDPVNDSDSDGLPNACDPAPGTPSLGGPLTCPAGIVGGDEDQDCYSNRADNCPTDNQLVNPAALPGPSNLPNALDSDGDGIGNLCDPSPMSPDGELVSLCLKATLQVGSPPGPVIAVQDLDPGPGCSWGDVDCNGSVNSVDALKVLRHSAGLPNTLPQGCTFNGDVDCSGVTNAVDALKLLRHAASLSNVVPPGCKPIGS